MFNDELPYAPLQQNMLGLKWALMASAKRLVIGDSVTSVNTQLNKHLTDAATAQGLLGFAYHLGNVRPQHMLTCAVQLAFYFNMLSLWNVEYATA